MNTITCPADALVHLPMCLFADRDGQRAEWWAAGRDDLAGRSRIFRTDEKAFRTGEAGRV